ncbi:MULTISPECIES: DMT family transporter [Paenibacillus]|uniref:Multidrug resistance protein EbrA n=1 Tax=Paenibacillus pabuli TaxID=1472 RepID=A0A855XPK2_9BACL|nr:MULTISPECIES: multidrug efflux SMR transporter [Paenibacillus]PWW36189.1 multidrug resistance protein EbrA [Paenibacillus pabuli]PXW03268.1 multidrug resistance protein EbrA [Paenibacillus taichungensis]
MAYLFLGVAILCEVFGSSMMKLSDGFRRKLPTLGLIIGMGSAFFLLSLALKTIPLGTAYATWSGVGTALTALVGILFYRESINTKKVLALILIIAGVVIMKLAH